MPRKQRVVKRRTDLPLSAAWVFTLMTGELSTTALPGWVSQIQDAVLVKHKWDNDPAGAALWTAHSESLIAEALEFQFTPYWVTNRKPSGPGFTRWRTEFLAAHRRTPIAPTTIHDSGHGEARYDH